MENVKFDYLTYNIFDPKGKYTDNEFIPTKSRFWDNQGICKVIVEHPAGSQQSQGSRFLIHFENKQKEEVFGFLSCVHVIEFTDLHRGHRRANPDEIFLEFQSGFHRFKVSDIQTEGLPPYIFGPIDLYFVPVSHDFCAKMASFNINFFPLMSSIQNQRVWILQFPENQGLHISTATLTNMWSSEEAFPLHPLSTAEGSSGSPLVQQCNTQYGVIGMHQGVNTNRTYNIAISASTINDVLCIALDQNHPVNLDFPGDYNFPQNVTEDSESMNTS